LEKCLTKSKSAAKEIKAENYIMETLFLKKSNSFTNKLSRAEQNLGGTYDDIKARDDIRTNDGNKVSRHQAVWWFISQISTSQILDK